MTALTSRLRRLWEALHTIRARLTLWYVLLLAVILVAFSSFLYLSLARDLYAEVDRLLADEAREVVTTLPVEGGQPQLTEGPGLLSAGVIVALYSPAGAFLAANVPRQLVPPANDALTRASQGQEAFATVQIRGRGTWQVFTRPVEQSGQVVGVLQVARSVRDVESALAQLLTLMVFAIPLTLVLAVCGGLFLAGRALDPIDRITRTAAEIGAENLSRRLRLRSRRDEVGRLADTFDRMLDRLEQAFQRQRQFAADASHELRTPLALLMSEADIALERPRRASEYRTVLTSIREVSSRMSQLLSELLTLARADAGEEAVVREPLALDVLADDVVAAMAPLAESRGIRLERGSGATAVIAGDQTRLTQLLVNLLDNALKYTPAGGRVTVSVARDAQRALLTVADTGVGIAAEHLPHLFERFYRVDKARSRDDGGAGLGLSICQWIAHAHGGVITVTSEPGAGTTFTVELPLAAEPPLAR